MKFLLALFAIYAAIVIDVIAGLNLNLYGYGREPFWFACGVVAVSSLMYRWQDARFAMITLVLCCAWLLVYPSKNGFDVVLSPTLLLGMVWWFWKKYKTKK